MGTCSAPLQPAYHRDTGHYPLRISHLAAPIRTGALDSCRRPIADSGAWRGPYLDADAVSSVGVRVGAVTIADSLRRSPADASRAGGAGTLSVVATGVDAEVAARLEAPRDAEAGRGGASIRWRPTAAGQGEVHYVIPVSGC